MGAFILDRLQCLSLTAPNTAKCRCGRTCRPPRRILFFCRRARRQVCDAFFHARVAAKNDQIHLRRARRKIERACRPPRRISIYLPPCAAQSLRRFYFFLVCGRENLRCVMPVCRLGGGKCGDPTLSNRKSAVLMAPRFLLLGKNSVKPCKYRPFGGRL